MVVVGAGILGLLSAGIFLAHAFEAYRAEYESGSRDSSRP
jgi:hypothetical protein